MSHAQRSRQVAQAQKQQTRTERRRTALELTEWKRKYEHSQLLPDPEPDTPINVTR